CNEFLDHARDAVASRTMKPRIFEFYRGHLDDFCQYAGGLRLDDLEPAHLDRWLARHPDWKGSRRGAVAAVKRAFNWAVDEGKIEVSPVKRYKKPPPRSRERFLTP